MHAHQLPTGDIHDFDFLAGSWRVTNRWLKTSIHGTRGDEEFPGASRCEVRMGGVVNVDEITFPTKGFSGLTVRLFDLVKHRWSIYWINSKTGVLDPPVLGGFDGDRGEFYGEDDVDGRSIAVRFLWLKLGADAARWEQAFSSDGQSWETNWVMDFERDSELL
jgi:hypothetical protein